MKTLALALAVALTAGCAQVGQFTRQGASAADGALAGGAWSVCTAATVGAVRRRYGNSPEQMTAWQLYCETELNNLAPVEVPR